MIKPGPLVVLCIQKALCVVLLSGCPYPDLLYIRHTAIPQLALIRKTNLKIPCTMPWAILKSDISCTSRWPVVSVASVYTEPPGAMRNVRQGFPCFNGGCRSTPNIVFVYSSNICQWESDSVDWSRRARCSLCSPLGWDPYKRRNLKQIHFHVHNASVTFHKDYRTISFSPRHQLSSLSRWHPT